LIKQASGGTLFLDEVGELPSSIQKTFLRVLQEHRFRPVGGEREIKSDFRLVAATNRNIETMVQKGDFRDDLFFRLRSIAIDLPPLRDVQEDIKDLTIHYMTKLCERYGTATKGFSPEIWEIFAKYNWPGNVRELIRALEKAIITARDAPVLFPRHLPDHIRIQVTRASINKKPAAQEKVKERTLAWDEFPLIQDVRDAAVIEAEQTYLKDLLEFTRCNIERACEISGISRSRLYALLKKYRLPTSN
jgi:two-component system NtrC family response regulator